jgi:short-subunit dehydrogenase
MDSYVMITGAAGGLGKALAAEYAERGHPLFLTDVDRERLECFGAGLERLVDVDVVCRACDLTDERAVDAMWSWIGTNGFVFDGLLNVAGIGGDGMFDGLDLGRVRDILKVNIEALVTMTRRVLEHRAPDGVLRIVNIASLASFAPMPLTSVYSASKRFVYNFSIALNEEMRGTNVSVMAVCPGGMPAKPADVKSVTDCQGIMGPLTEKNVGWVAKRVYEQSLKGKAVYIPGRLNVLLRALSKVIPEKVKARILARRWERAAELMRN